MPTLNKETKGKALMLKMQLTVEQRVFVVKTYYKTSSYMELKEASIEFVRFYVENNARIVSCRRNRLGLSKQYF